MTFGDVAPVLPGETFAGKYRVERILGRGGMGIVVAARHLELDERVAIKFLLRKDDEGAVARFQREARAAAKVKSEHVCRVYDVGRLDTGEPYLVMEYLDGVDLSERLRAERRLPIARVAAWMVEACAALAEAHGLGIVHRDLKPANIFLAKRGDDSSAVKLLDFGISKMTSADGMTSTTAMMGTPIYMSPEQVASAKDVDARTDIWSLGVIMYELVSGKPPFAAESIIQLSVKIREQALPPLDSGDAAFDAIVEKCLAKSADDRFANVGELARALAPIAGPSSADLASRASRTSTTAKAALAETVRDERDDAARLDAVEQATLEPLSTAASAPTPSPRSSTPWTRIGVLAVAAAIAAAIVVRTTATEESPPASTPSAAADVAPPPPPTASSPIPEPATAATATAATASAEPPKTNVPKPRPTSAPATASAAVTAAAPSETASATPPTPEPTTSAKKKRELDRDDPYGH